MSKMLLVVPQYKLWFSFPHPGILYIASAARAAGGNVELLDGGVMSKRQLFRKLSEKAAHHDSVAITASVAHIASAVEIAKFIRGNFPAIRIIWGGPYPSSQHTSLGPDIADIIVLGEGETQISRICKGEKLSEIPSIVYFEDGIRRENTRQGYIEDLDKLPFPAHDLVDFSTYQHPGLKPAAQIISSRGCPYQCINCTKSIHGNGYRERSPENVVDEISMLVHKYNVREIHFWDDNLTLDVERVKKICSLILSKDLHRKVRFAVPAGIRADIYDEEMFCLMKRAGFYLFAVAVESGEQRTIDKIGKRLDLAKVPGNLAKLEHHGFRLMLYFMMGFPFETEDDMDKTANFATTLPGHHLNCFAVVPLPGSKLFEDWGSTPEFKDYLAVNYDNPIPQARSPARARALGRMIRKAYLKFYASPRRLFNTFLLMAKEGSLFSDAIFAVKTLFKILSCGHK